MSKEELISELERLATAVTVDHPNTAIVLLTLCGAIAGGQDGELARVVKRIARDLIGRGRNRQRDAIVRLN